MTIPENLAGYLAARDRERAQQVGEALGALTPREQALVKEAAVMGYVQGALAAGAVHPQIPPDSAVLTEVVGACLAMPDLYPTLARGET